MKVKTTFTKQEAKEISTLIKRKLKADKNGQKSIRAKIRKLGFYSTDFEMGAGYGYTVEDFLRVITVSKTPH